MRVVLDTSVLVSALLGKGAPHRLLELAESGALTLCVTRETLAELQEVLDRPRFRARLAQRGATVEQTMAGVVRLAALYAAEPAPGAVQRDPDDEIFIECAVSAQAAYLISGDRDLLELEQYGKVRVVTPRQFLETEFPGE